MRRIRSPDRELLIAFLGYKMEDATQGSLRFSNKYEIKYPRTPSDSSRTVTRKAFYRKNPTHVVYQQSKWGYPGIPIRQVLPYKDGSTSCLDYDTTGWQYLCHIPNLTTISLLEVELGTKIIGP